MEISDKYRKSMADFISEYIDVKNGRKYEEDIVILESKKFYIIKKPGNPSRLLTYPVAPELFALYAIPVVFP